MGPSLCQIFVLTVLFLGSRVSCGSESPSLTDVTSKVFGSDDDLKRLPVAFGDFNGDKMTDLFVLPHSNDNNRKSVAVLLADDGTFSVTSEPKYFGASSKGGKRTECFLNGENIEAVIPGDFDGDGGMDVLVVSVPEDDLSSGNVYQSTVLWGDHDHKAKTHKLICPDKMKTAVIRLDMVVQPMAVDVNADYVADLFGSRVVNGSEQTGVWIFNQNRKEPKFLALNTTAGGGGHISRPFHSNAYLDLDRDGNSDIFLTAEDRFEIWLNNPSTSASSEGAEDTLKYKLEKTIGLEDCHGKADCIIGQVSFVDIDFDGTIDALVPLCYDGSKCRNGTLLTASLRDLTAKGVVRPFKKVEIIGLGNEMDSPKPSWKFAPYSKSEALGSGIYSPLAMRFGDFNLDGYPDFLIRMKQDTVPNPTIRTHFLLNVESSGGDTARGFMLREEVMDSVLHPLSGVDNSEDAVPLATFFDWKEDGVEDIMVVRNKTGGGSAGKVSVGAFTNATLSGDAYFVKIIVLSGICNEPQFKHSCKGGKVDVPYGTNMPGQTICYRTQKSGASIGSEYNFVETCAAQTRHWEQIIPNSQLYVIPYPPTRVGDWSMKLFVTPSKSIIFTALSLLGLCVVCVLIILFLHWREKVQDRKEKLQEANRFHFDAM